jgi:hypothetical protein
MTKFLKPTKLGQLGVLELWGFKHTTTLFITLVESFEQHCVKFQIDNQSCFISCYDFPIIFNRNINEL